MYIYLANINKKQNRKLNIWWDSLLLVLVCFPHNSAYYTLSKMLNYVEIGIFLWSILVFFQLKIYKNQKKLRFVLVLIGWIVICTVINGTNSILAMRLAYNIFSVCVLTQHLINLNAKKSLRIIVNMFATFIIIQLISAVTHSFGIHGVSENGTIDYNYFFGIRVEFSKIFIFAIALSMILSCTRKTKDKLIFLITIVAGVYFVVMEHLSTGYITFGTFLLMLLVMKIWGTTRDFKIVLFIILAFCLVFNFTLGNLANTFSWLLNGILNESLSLNGRTYLWQSAIDQMEGIHWLIGNGYAHDYEFIIGIRNWSASTAHSQYINILFCYGIPGLILYLRFCIEQILIISKNSSATIKSILYATLASMFVMGIATTTYNTLFMYIFYVLVINYDKVFGWVEERTTA